MRDLTKQDIISQLKVLVDKKTDEFLNHRFMVKVLENKKEDQEELKLIAAYFYQNMKNILDTYTALCETTAKKASDQQEKALFQQYAVDLKEYIDGVLKDYEYRFGSMDKTIQTKELNPLMKEYKQYYNSLLEGTYYENMATIFGNIWFICEVAEKAKQLPNFESNPYFELFYSNLNNLYFVNNALIRIFSKIHEDLTDEEMKSIYKAFTDAIYYEDIFYSSCLVEVN